MRQGEPSGTTTPAAPLAGAPPAADPVAWGSIAILERTGGDHFGDVFRARDPVLGREVTLRLRAADAARDDPREARFLDEAKRLASVRHPNVLPVHGADRRDGRLGLWADPAPGPTLEQHLLGEGPMSPAEARRVGLDLCRALAAIHAVGIIHREVRTSTVVREEGGRIVLMDSGSLGDLPRRPLNAAAAGAGEEDALERTLAPEQLRGEGVSLSTDVHGLGVLLYRLASGHDPTEAARAPGSADALRRRPIVPLRDRRPALPLDFVRVVEKAIDPEPMRRYPNAVAFERALASTLMASGSEPATAAPPEPAPEWLSLEYLARWRTGIFSAAAFAFGCLVAVMLIAEPSPSRNTVPGSAEANAQASPPSDGPPMPAALAARWRPATSSADAEPDEAWAYKPIPKRVPYGPVTQRAAHGGSPAATPAMKAPSGAVAGAAAVLRVLARGPGTPAEPAARANALATLTLSTEPDYAQVVIDGARQQALTNATYQLEPGVHSVVIEKPGYERQELPRIELAAGQKMRATITLAASRADSLRTH